MKSNIERYRTDLERLIKTGESLKMAVQKAFRYEEFQAELRRALKDDKKADEVLQSIPSFRAGYQSWYSEAVALIRQLLPDRLTDFVRLYEKPRVGRKDITYANYVIEDALQGLQVTGRMWGEKVVGGDAAISLFQQQLNIVKSIRERFESSLFDIVQLVQADLFDSELEIAIALNRKGFVRAAGAVAGVVLESHLLQVCHNHEIRVRKKKPGINDLAQLLKDSDVIDIPEWRKLQYLADLRNLCDHKRETEPKPDDIDDLIAGVTKVVKLLF